MSNCAVAQPLGTLHVTTGNPLANIQVYHPDRGLVFDAMGEATFEAEPSMYRVDVNAVGTTSSQWFVVEPSITCEAEMPSPSPGSIVPSESNTHVLRSDLDVALKQLSEGANKHAAYILVCSWGLTAGVPSLRALGKRKRSEPSQAKGERFSIRRWMVEPGPWQLGFGGDESKAVIAVPAEKGWVTEVWFRDSAPDFPVVLMRPVNADIDWDRRLKTEGALRAMMATKAPLTFEASKEPIQDMAGAYRELRLCQEETDKVLAPLWLGEQTSPLREVRDRCESRLTAVQNISASWLKSLPNSVDFRLLAVAALWERATLSMDLPEKMTDGDLGKLARFVRVRPKIEVGALILMVIALIIGLQYLAEGFGSATILPLPKVDEDSQVSFVTGALMIAAFVIGGAASIWGAIASARARRIVFEDPPLFAEGMGVLMRLAALYETMCPKDSRAARTALRQTSNAIWTTWDAKITKVEAENRFKRILADIESTLTTMTGSQDCTPSVEKASVHLARALRVPIGLVRKFVASLDGVARGKLVRLAPGEIATVARDALRDTARAAKVGGKRTARQERSLAGSTTAGEKAASWLGALMLLFVFGAWFSAPVFLQTKLSAKKSTVIANIKQVAVGVLMYAADNDDVLPFTISFSEEGSVGYADLVQPYLKNQDVFLVPGDNPRSAGKVATSFAPNLYVMPGAAEAGSPKPLSTASVANVGSTALLVDSVLYSALPKDPCVLAGNPEGTGFVNSKTYSDLWQGVGDLRASLNQGKSFEEADTRLGHKQYAVAYVDGHSRVVDFTRTLPMVNREAQALWDPYGNGCFRGLRKIHPN